MNKEEFITDFLYRVYNDFKYEIGQRKTCCILKELRFDGGHIPPYEDSAIQQAYLLRYAYAYFFEYYAIYYTIISQLKKDDEIKVLSVGSGCGLDYYALLYAMDEQQFNWSNLHYTAVDKVNWQYFYNVGGNLCYFNNDVAELDINDSKEYNIIIFPKTIGELNKQQFNFIKEYIEYKVEDKFYLINSLRESYGVDSNRFNKLVDYIGKMRGELVCGDDIEVKVLESRGVYGYNGMYNVSYPDEIKKYIENILVQCQYYNSFGQVHEEKCLEMNRKVVLRTDHIRVQIADFYTK